MAKIIEPNYTIFLLAAEEAKWSSCLRAKCGAVVVSASGIILGTGFNSPAGGSAAKCELGYQPNSRKPKSDQTCCMHAEWRAILDSLRYDRENLQGGIIYFSRVDNDGKILKSGDPYCTPCSRMALDVGLGHFALLQDNGMKLFTTEEYNDLSYNFHGIESR